MTFQICFLLVGAVLSSPSVTSVWASMEAVICASQWELYLFHSGGGEIDRAGDRLVLERDISSENAMTFYHPYLFITVDGNGLSLLMDRTLSPSHIVAG